LPYQLTIKTKQQCLERSEIGKYRTKESVLKAKVGSTWITPNNREYQIEYRKEGRKYIIILLYRGGRMQVSETDFNNTPTDILLQAMDNNIDNPII